MRVTSGLRRGRAGRSQVASPGVDVPRPLITVRHLDPAPGEQDNLIPAVLLATPSAATTCPSAARIGAAIEQAPIVISSDLPQRLFPRR